MSLRIRGWTLFFFKISFSVVSPPPPNERSRVALLVETSLAPGRDMLLGIARYAREHGAWSIYHEARSLEEGPPHWLRDWDGDGIIARVQNQSIHDAVVASGIPTVDVLGVIHGDLPLVHVDHHAISQLAAEHLLERGFQNFGFVGIANENWSASRREAFARSVEALDFECSVYDLPRHIAIDATWDTRVDKLAKWAHALPKPCGVMVASDQRGPELLEACRRAKIAVPDAIAVVGVDNDEPLCEVSAPPLSSVNPDHRQVGYEAANLLSSLMAGEKTPTAPLLLAPTTVETRLSSDVLAIDDRGVADALRYIREYGCNNIQVDDVVATTSMSRSVLQRRFRRLLDRSVHDEIIRVRINRVKALLVGTDLPIDAIAQRAGFRHQEYVGAVFKREVGTTPARYRRQHS